MIAAGQRPSVLIATQPVDVRCGHQALAMMVQTELRLDPYSGVAVVFRSKRGDRLKILVWDGTGMVLIYKVLEESSFVECFRNLLSFTIKLSYIKKTCIGIQRDILMIYLVIMSACIQNNQRPVHFRQYLCRIKYRETKPIKDFSLLRN
jgi:hypothetical protein